jgi:hypothetical protein
MTKYDRLPIDKQERRDSYDLVSRPFNTRDGAQQWPCRSARDSLYTC